MNNTLAGVVFLVALVCLWSLSTLTLCPEGTYSDLFNTVLQLQPRRSLFYYHYLESRAYSSFFFHFSHSIYFSTHCNIASTPHMSIKIPLRSPNGQQIATFNGLSEIEDTLMLPPGNFSSWLPEPHFCFSVFLLFHSWNSDPATD